MNPFKKLSKSGESRALAAGRSEAAPQASRPVSGLEGKPSAAPRMPTITISHEAIAQAAYFRWQRYGGDEQTNWRLAEQELRDEAEKLGLNV